MRSIRTAIGSLVDWSGVVLLAVVVANLAASPVLPLTIDGAADSQNGNPILPQLCIAWTSPADGEDNVSLGAPIVVAFCEPVDWAYLWFSLAPSAEPYTITWSGGDTILTIQHTRLFDACTQYWVTLASGLDQYAWTFFTVCAFVRADDLDIRRM